MRRIGRPWYIAVTVEGLNIERFLRQAGEKGICLNRLCRTAPKRVSALVQETQLPILEQMVQQGGWKLKIGERRGAGRAAEWLQRRWLLAAAVVCAGIALLAASRVVWQLDIQAAGAYEADIRLALQEQGIHLPMLRSQVNIGKLREALEWRYPRIAWFECGWRGTTLVIRPAEGILPRVDAADQGAFDIVAERDAVVKSVVTVAGTPMVQVGDVVRKGEVLIKGEERTANGEVKPVRAMGVVTGRIWRAASVQISAVERITVYTGREERAWTIRTPWFDLWPMADSEFAQYDAAVSETLMGGIFLPIVLHTETRMEAEYEVKPRNLQEAEKEAKAAAEQKLREKVGGQESLIDIWGNCSMIDSENMLSVAIGELLVEIGVQVPVSGMAAPDELSE